MIVDHLLKSAVYLAFVVAYYILSFAGNAIFQWGISNEELWKSFGLVLLFSLWQCFVVVVFLLCKHAFNNYVAPPGSKVAISIENGTFYPIVVMSVVCVFQAWFILK